MRKKLELSTLTKNIDQIADENRDPNIITQVRHYKLITPLFGGGVEAGANDEITPISGKAVRGQLRFWWRATRGTGTLKEIKKREDEIWGAASTKKKKLPSQVQIEIKETIMGIDKKPFRIIHKVRGGQPQYSDRTRQPIPEMKSDENIAPPYAAFPLQPPTPHKVGDETKGVRDGIEFTVRIKFPSKNRKDVKAAIWAWETFGGIGARTRRGFGALELVWAKEGNTDITPDKIKANEVDSKLREQLRVEDEKGGMLANGTWDMNVPHLSPAVELKTKSPFTGTNRHIAAWKFLIKCLQDFRQLRKPSRTKPQGQSYWPEPDKVRRLVDAKKGTSNFNHPVVHPVEKFPRAQFGLPIIFHFNKDEMVNGRKFDVELKPINHKRLASPLILRPIACANDETAALALILETATMPPNWVELIDSFGTNYGKVITDLVVSDIKDIKPMFELDPSEVDVLKSFLKKIK